MMLNMNKFKAILIALVILTVSRDPAVGQVLEALPDSHERSTGRNSKVVKEEAVEHARVGGTTMSGNTGLVTIPIPARKKEHTAGASFKFNNTTGDLLVNGTNVRIEKDEYVYGVRYNARPNLEISLSNLHYERSSNPVLAGVDTDKDHVAAGMKYTTNIDEKEFCMGFNFAPMSAKEMNMADIEQIESLRNVYLTMAETISSNFTGYMNISSVFTNNQKIDFGNGVIQKVNRKDILLGGIGLEYKIADSATVFGEAKFGNYRDFDYFKKDSVRHRIHAGARVGSENAALELMGLNVTDGDPTFVIGGSLGF